MAATIRLIPAMVDWMTVMIFAAGALGALLMLRSVPHPGWRRFGVMAVLGTLGTFTALFVLSFMTAIYADYGVAALPLIIVAAAGVVQWTVQEAPPAKTGAATALVTTLLVIGVLPSLVSHLSDGTRFDYRPAFARIAADRPGDAVFTWPIVLQREYAPALRAHELMVPRPRLDSLLALEGRAWAVVSVKRFGIAGDDTGEIASWLGDHCRKVDQYQRPRLDYRMYRVELWSCATTL